MLSGFAISNEPIIYIIKLIKIFLIIMFPLCPIASGNRLRLAKNKLNTLIKSNSTKKKDPTEGTIINDGKGPDNNQPLKNKDILRQQGNEIEDLL
jgi:hypothetical protein